MQHKVTLFNIHLHYSHKLQPLDVWVFETFNSYNSSTLNAQLQQKPGISLTTHDIAGLFKIANKKAIIPTNIIARFKKNGILPL